MERAGQSKDLNPELSSPAENDKNDRWSHVSDLDIGTPSPHPTCKSSKSQHLPVQPFPHGEESRRGWEQPLTSRSLESRSCCPLGSTR